MTVTIKLNQIPGPVPSWHSSLMLTSNTIWCRCVFVVSIVGGVTACIILNQIKNQAIISSPETIILAHF